MTPSKDAEKEYLTRTGGSAWERAKPFSHPGADTLLESAGLLQDFALAMLTLQPAPDELVLDLGAGGCWSSDLLSRLNRRSVAIDISIEMLITGRRRENGRAIVAVVGDMERLPFRTGSFSKALCLNAIHHVPDLAAALREIARVLQDDGAAYFSEPGVGHSAHPNSIAAVRDFGVLEQDIIINDFAIACQAAGFQSVRLKPLSYAAPDFELTPEEYGSWSRLARSKRPFRAAEKIYRAVGELLGVGKSSALFEEAFAMRLVRRLRPLVEEHPVILAAKQERSGVAASYRGLMSIGEIATPIAAGAKIEIHVKMTNSGTARWKAAPVRGVGHVQVGAQLLDASGRVVSRDYARAALPHDVEPGETCEALLSFPAPEPPGSYQLKIDLVAEGITWFESAGSEAVTRDLAVN